MKPRSFGYLRPSSVAEAVAALDAEPRARVLAGGQSLMPALNLREEDAALLVDVTRLEELRGIAVDDGVLRVGAAEPMWDLERSPLVATHAPLLRRALGTVGAPGIRSRATLGGSTAWSDSTSQLPATLLALDARLVTTSRIVAARDHFALERGRALGRSELIVAIELESSAGAGFALHHVRRSHITWPVAGAVAVTSSTGTAIGLYGAATRPVAGRGDTPAAALAAALGQVDPPSDERAGAAYREAVLPELARRALADAEASR